MPNDQTSTDYKEIILRQTTDHIFQCLHRIEDNIEYIVFLRKNDKLQQVSQRFYLTQIDRFSRDTLIAFNQIIDKDRKASTFHSLIHNIKDKSLKKKMLTRFEKLRVEAEIVISHRNKVIAHHEIAYNSSLADYYPAQPFSYFYSINPCFCNRLKIKFEKLFWHLKQILDIDGVGMFVVGGPDFKKVFKKSALSEKTANKHSIEVIHKCRYKDCLLKNRN